MRDLLIVIILFIAGCGMTGSPDGAFQGSLTCTRIIGFSQTREWFVDNAAFESIVDNNKWELVWAGGTGTIENWADPNFVGWNNLPVSACAQNSRNPDRIILNISGASRAQSQWESDIAAAVATVRQRHPNATRILLQPVVGGPHHQTCYVGTDLVRASVNHPVIDAAIHNISGGDVAAGASPEVGSCSEFDDAMGHLTTPGEAHVSNQLGNFYK